MTTTYMTNEDKWQARRLLQQERHRDMMETMLQKLIEIVDDCRDNMHEPDEQNVYGKVVGGTRRNGATYGLDNAMVPTQEMVERDEITLDFDVAMNERNKFLADMTLVLFGYDEEMTYVRIDESTEQEEIKGVFNLADMIALIKLLADDRKQLLHEIENLRKAGESATNIASYYKQLGVVGEEIFDEDGLKI